MEESRVVGGMDKFAVPVTGVNTGKYSVIADPETAELDQAYLQYRNGGFKLKAGRQVLTHDGHRFLGHVGWRQDRQSFDGLTVDYATNNNSNFTYSFFNQRNRIFAEEADLASKDHIFKGSVATRFGNLTGYSYLLEVDNQTDNSLDTYGMSLIGKTAGDAGVSYTLEYATQSSVSGMNGYDTDYLMAEAGISRAGVKYKLTYEAMGSDGGNFGFSTPLATLHKFNGWADTFLRTPDQGLADIAVTAAGKIGAGKWTVSYHDFRAADSTPGVRDFGSELDLLYTRPLSDRFLIGLKYARYSAGDSVTGKVDTDKLWVWTNFRF